MVDQDRFQALSKKWSAWVDQFLDETPEGQMALYSLPEGECPIFAAMLKACADSFEPADSKSSPAKKYFGRQRHGVFVMATVRLQEVLPDEYPNEGLARKRCQELYLLALNVAKTISHERHEEPRTVPKPMSEAPLPDDVREALDMASQPGIDVSCAIEDAPDPDDSKEAERRKTRPAPRDEIESLLATTSFTPVIDPPDLPTIPVDSARLKDIKGHGLGEMLEAYSRITRSSTSEPPPVHVSAYPASPPPAPEPGVSLGIESSIPPPSANDGDQPFSTEDAEIVAGDLLDPKALEEVHEAEIDAAFDEELTKVRKR